MGAVHMINNASSKCKNCMVLIRKLTLIGLTYNVRVYAKFVPMKKNILADALSRGLIDEFWKHAPKSMKKQPRLVPEEIWSMSKIWKD